MLQNSIRQLHCSTKNDIVHLGNMQRVHLQTTKTLDSHKKQLIINMYNNITKIQ